MLKKGYLARAASAPLAAYQFVFVRSAVSPLFDTLLEPKELNFG